MAGNNDQDWEKLTKLLGRLRPREWDPNVKDNISTLIMKGNFAEVDETPTSFPDLLHKPLTRNQSKQKEQEEPEEADSAADSAITVFQKSKATLTILQTENPKVALSHSNMADMHSEFLQLAKKHIYPYRFSEDAVPFDFFRNLFKYRHFEATVRVFIDALLKPIKKQNELNICLEEPLGEETGKKKKKVKQKSKKSDSQDKTKDSEKKIEKPDYLIFYKDMPLGVVETKNARYLTRDSITQCREQLLYLHEKEQEVKKRNGPLFGVVTDALHFIFIKLTEDKQFQFEKENYGETSQSSETIISEIKVHTANTWKDLDDIAAIINGLCQQRIKQNFTYFDVSPRTEVRADVGIPVENKRKFYEHTGEGNYRCLEEGCGEVRSKEETMCDHVRYYHLEITLRCEECNQECDSVAELNSHFQQVLTCAFTKMELDLFD